MRVQKNTFEYRQGLTYTMPDEERCYRHGLEEGAKQMLLALYKRELIEEAIYHTLIVEIDEDWRHFETHWKDYTTDSKNDPL